jgi:flagellar motor switch protein FliN
MTAPRPLDWITEIEASLVELEEKPQFGLPAPFDWRQLEREIQQLVGHPELKLSHTVKGWVTSNQLFAGIGGRLFPLTIEWSPLQAPSFFVTDEQNLKDLMSDLFESEEAANFFYESPYVLGFYNYFAAEMLRLLSIQPFASPLTPRLGPHPEEIRQIIGEESCFVIDIALSLRGKNFWGRILLPERFRHDWKTYFAHLSPPPLSEEMKEKIKVEIGLQVAHSRLSFKEWQKVKKGDFVVLDHCSYDPLERKGAVVLTINQKPVFRGRFKDGEIKITNYPVYEEVSDAMQKESFGKSFGPEDEEEDLYGGLSEDEESEFEEEEEDIFAGLEPHKEPLKEKEAKKIPEAAEPAHAEEGPALSLAELPVHLTVEVGRIHMTASALMNLAPGNLLELNVSPEQGVDLVINGKKVGRGELIRMGDVLGVRILSL